MDNFNTGIIGLGVGWHHIGAFESHPNCNVTDLCDFSEQIIRKAGSKFPEKRVSKNASDILENDDVDIVSIASFDNYHFDQVQQAISNGKHVFVEKPICLEYEHACKIKKNIDAHPELKISSNLNLRTSPRFIRLKKEYELGNMGEIFYIEADYLWGRIQKLESGWRADMPFYSIIHGAAVHMIDLILWLTQLKPIEVTGYGNNISTAKFGFRFNDFAVILLKFENGMIAKITGNAGCVHRHFHKIEVYGTQGTFINNSDGGFLIYDRTAEDYPDPLLEAYPAVEDKGQIIHSFVESLINKKHSAIVPTEDVFTTMSVCFAAEESVQKGSPVRVRYI